jgi:polyisoprenoid-binding protein YceI
LQAVTLTKQLKQVTANDAAETVALDSGSVVAWRGFKTYTPMESQHLGTVNVQEGTFEVANGKLVGGTITIDMNSITNTDIEDEGKRGYLEGHLKSQDFFFVDSFPTAVFEIVEVLDPSEATKYSTVTGNLTIRGTTNSITFPADVVVGEEGVKFMAPTFSIDRTLWGAKFHDRDDATIAESLKDDLIDHSIELTIKVKATK